ncbi:hypothetical protein B0H13DRAFT_1924020 [Mycena leptocephala]|nr:hypothetical protein B0H13DRAFT_1924020 [Mycena leptocephala]
MLWPTVLLVCSLATASTAAAVNSSALSTAITTAEVVSPSALAAAIGGSVGAVFGVQTETGDTRIIYQAFPSNNIMQLSVSGPFSNVTFSTDSRILVPGANVSTGTPINGFIIGPQFTTNLTVSEWYWLSTNGIHWGTGTACPDCIQNSGFVASNNTIGLYAMATINGGRRVGFLSSDQSGIVEVDRVSFGSPYIIVVLVFTNTIRGLFPSTHIEELWYPLHWRVLHLTQLEFSEITMKGRNEVTKQKSGPGGPRWRVLSQRSQPVFPSLPFVHIYPEGPKFPSVEDRPSVASAAGYLIDNCVEERGKPIFGGGEMVSAMSQRRFFADKLTTAGRTFGIQNTWEGGGLASSDVGCTSHRDLISQQESFSNLNAAARNHTADDTNKQMIAALAVRTS